MSVFGVHPSQVCRDGQPPGMRVWHGGPIGVVTACGGVQFDGGFLVPEVSLAARCQQPSTSWWRRLLRRLGARLRPRGEADDDD
jgi:hypothetical protein